jgi:hypothetical protein
MRGRGVIRRADSRTSSLFMLALGTVACVSVLAQPLGAQWLPAFSPSVHPARIEDSTYKEVPAPDLAFLGALGGAVGCLPGIMAGAAAYELLHGSGGGDIAGLEYAVWGCLAGVAVGSSAAVHLANHRRGNVWLDLLAATGAAAIGFGARSALHPPGPTGWLIPIAMVGVTVATEKSVEHREP